MFILNALGDALAAAGSMGWEILWPLILGFALSGIIQAVVRTDRIMKLMHDDSPRAISVATGLGALSSSCSYAAVALARALFRKGASLSSAMAFEVASTNLVVELGLILAFVMGWQFTLAEFIGGPIMIILIALGFRLWMRGKILDAAREQADKGLAGSMEGHAAMDMSVGGDGGFLRRLLSRDGWTSVSHIFVMEWAAILRDVVIGLLIAGAASAWIPDAFWRTIFASDHPLLAKIIDPLIGPVVAMLTFVCSVGNVPLAAVLWNGGISFGGVISFLFADLLIVPILLIYRKYYGKAMLVRLVRIFYVASVLAGYVVELLFGVLGLIPGGERHADTGRTPISWNYTSVLNLVFAVVAVVLVFRFFTTGGRSMLSMMGGDAEAGGG
jgi:hypothetical protein